MLTEPSLLKTHGDWPLRMSLCQAAVVVLRALRTATQATAMKDRMAFALLSKERMSVGGVDMRREARCATSAHCRVRNVEAVYLVEVLCFNLSARKDPIWPRTRPMSLSWWSSSCDRASTSRRLPRAWIRRRATHRQASAIDLAIEVTGADDSLCEQVASGRDGGSKIVIERTPGK